MRQAWGTRDAPGGGGLLFAIDSSWMDFGTKDTSTALQLVSESFLTHILVSFPRGGDHRVELYKVGEAAQLGVTSGARATGLP